MEVGSIGGGAPVQAQVSLQKKASKQEEAVVNKLLEGVKQSAPAPDGRKLLAVA